ncbi:MAG: NAD(P)/FAD-dependent oxidoreductase, partial [Polyangiaceae bacterium]
MTGIPGSGSDSAANSVDVIVVGAGHNGLVAATFLARAGLKVHVVEDKDVIGGATRTEKPFKNAPELGTSTGAYLLGLMPPELIQKLGVDIPVLRRDPHYFLPTTGDRHLLLGSDGAKNRASLESFFSKADADANDAMQEEIGQIRDDIAPTWLEEPLSIEATAEKYVRSTLRSVFVDLCRKPVSHYISRFAFKSDLVRAMYAVTDGFSGLFGSWDTPGTGMNFLVHNMCRLPNAGDTWMIVKGGMGTVSGAFADAAKRAGATFEIGNGVEEILRDGNSASGVRLKNGKEIRAKTIVVNADPFRMQTILGKTNLPAEYNNRLDG